MTGRRVFTATGAAVGVMAAVALLGSCSSTSGGKTTCSEFAAMSKDTGLMSSASDEQGAVIRSMLRDHDKDTGATNVSMAYLQIIAYCNIYGGKSGSNQNAPIESISGLR